MMIDAGQIECRNGNNEGCSLMVVCIVLLLCLREGGKREGGKITETTRSEIWPGQ